jgi:YidC/Oxa1 family membrane protein insertase
VSPLPLAVNIPLLTPLWNEILTLLMESLKFIWVYVGDLGLAIIVLTVILRIIIVPLTWKQTKSMFELQQIQPKLKELQEKYKNDKEKLQEKTMAFYQENKVNPFGGCLPLILQMPIFIALFTVLREYVPTYIKTLPAIEQAAAKQFWIVIPDLTQTPGQVWGAWYAAPAKGALAAASYGLGPALTHVLPYALFVVLFGLSVWLPQYLLTKDPVQRRTGSYMAVMMLWFGWISPAGVLLYWVTSSAWQVVQQQITTSMITRSQEAGAK